MVLSSERSIVLEAGSHGAIHPYRLLRPGPAEARLRRLDLTPHASPSRGASSLLHLVHISDLHAVDVQSPGRYEFMQRLAGGPDVMKVVLPAHRPHEFLHLHLLEAMLRTVNRLTVSPVTGAPVDLLLSTGDNIDNAQQNELDWFLRLMEGGEICPISGAGRYEGVQAVEWGDEAYWHPDPVDDLPKRDHGFPTHPGLLDEVMAPFTAEGVNLPWLTCYGNHDAFLLGAAHVDATMNAILTGDQKAIRCPPHFQVSMLADFIDHPDRLLTAPFRTVTPDPQRRYADRAAYGEVVRRAAGGPPSHGFGGDAERLDGVHDIGAARLILLDTVNPGGDWQGSLGTRQLRWLEERLLEVHSRYRTASGVWTHTSADDRLVVLCTHMPAASLVNARPVPPSTPGADEPRVLEAELLALLHRFPNVVLWLNGHTHHNKIRPHPDPTGATPGFWEVTTCSQIDWPGESRVVELVDNQDGTLSVYCSMLTPDVPLDPRDAMGFDRLVSIGREVMANDPYAGASSPLAGAPHDRTVELVVLHPLA
jgi:metallophosphoesterase (TIGR03767 family)